MKTKQGEGGDGLTCRPITVLRSSKTSKNFHSAVMGCSAIPAGRKVADYRLTNRHVLFFFLLVKILRRHLQRMTFSSELFLAGI